MLDRETTLRQRLAEELEERLAEFARWNQPQTLDQLAEAMGEYGKEAVIRIKNQERPVTVALVERLAHALRLAPEELLARIIGTRRSQIAMEAAERRINQELETFMRMFTQLGVEILADLPAMDAVRALAAIDDEGKRRQVADMVMAIARDHERMTGARRLLVGPPSRQAQGEGGPTKKR